MIKNKCGPNPASPEAASLQLPTVRCFTNSSVRRGVSALDASSWADVKVIGAEGTSSLSPGEVPVPFLPTVQMTVLRCRLQAAR